METRGSEADKKDMGIQSEDEDGIGSDQEKPERASSTEFTSHLSSKLIV